MAVKFKRNNLSGNALSLVKYFGLKREQDVPVVSFAIETNGASTGLILVGDRKYKSALFLLYLAKLKLNRQPNYYGAIFQMDSKAKELTILCFGDDICNDAINNPETKHTTIRDLLADGQVIVHINCK